MKDGLLKKKDALSLPRSTRWAIYSVILFTSITSAMDGAVYTTAITKVKEDLQFDNKSFGQFSSMFFFGKIIGSFCFIFIMNLVNRKYLFLLALFTTSGGLFVFTMTTIKPILFSVRSILGFFNVFFIIYFPVWCDQYGVKKFKTLKITLIQITIPIGNIVGSILSTFLPWRYAIYTAAACNALAGLFLSCFSSNYFAHNLYPSASPATDATAPSFYEVIDKANSKQSKEKKSDSSIISLLKNPIFIVYAFSRSFLLFPLIASSTFINEYMEIVLGVTSKQTRLATLTSLTIVSTFGGSILGGFIGTLIGGYENKKASIVLVVLQLIASFGALAVPLMNSLLYYAIAFGVYMAFISAIMPIITGMVITSVPNQQRAMANSLTSFIVNSVGMMPAPYIYGLLYDMYKATNPRFALQVVNYVPFVCLALFIVGMIMKYSEKKVFDEKQEGTPLQEVKEETKV